MEIANRSVVWTQLRGQWLLNVLVLKYLAPQKKDNIKIKGGSDPCPTLQPQLGTGMEHTSCSLGESWGDRTLSSKLWGLGSGCCPSPGAVGGVRGGEGDQATPNRRPSSLQGL